jgi:hypothetical protein
MNLPSRRAPFRRAADPGLHKELAMQTAKWMLAAVAIAVPLVAHAEGLKPHTDTLPWSRWQARLALGSPAPLWRAGLDGDRAAWGAGSATLMGDYYFSRSLAAGGIASGFRATSGLIVGPRTALWTARPTGLPSSGLLSVDRRLFEPPTGLAGIDAPDTTALPYVGVGYSGLSLRGGWSVSADLGLVALAPGHAVKLGRVLGGTQGLDELLRDLRLSPVIQLGVSYSF